MPVGRVTSTETPSAPLLTKIEFLAETYNQMGYQFRNLLTRNSRMPTERIYSWDTQGFQPIGSDSGRAPSTRGNYMDITLSTPKPYGFSIQVDRDFITRGGDPEVGMDRYRNAIAQDQLLQSQLCVKAALSGSGYWANDGNIPPAYQGNTFLSTHTHYLGYSVSGSPLIAHVVDMIRHLEEHGLDKDRNDFVMMCNGKVLDRIKKLAEWVSEEPHMTNILEQLQQDGFTPAFRTMGVNWVKNDWIPDYYLWLQPMSYSQGPPMRSPLFPKDTAVSGVEDEILGVFPHEPDRTFWLNVEFVRYAATPNVVWRSNGVVAYLNSGTYTAPSDSALRLT